MPVAPDDPRVAKCGFAKLLGPDVEVYMRKYEITIGRRSKSTALDVVLGDNMNISRLHAKIRYNFQTGRFELEVLGKNGVTVKGTLHTPGSVPVVLQSQDHIQIGESSFYFLLPKDLSKLKSTGKRPRSSGGAAANRPSRPQSATAVSEEEVYSEDYDPNYQSDAYDDKPYAHPAAAHDQYAEEYEGGEEEYEEDADVGAEEGAAPHGGGEVYDEDEEEEQYDEQYNGGQYAAAPGRHGNHYGH